MWPAFCAFFGTKRAVSMRMLLQTQASVDWAKSSALMQSMTQLKGDLSYELSTNGSRADQQGRKAVRYFSRLLNDRIIVLCDEVNQTTASLVVAQMLFLEGQDSEKDISFYINSPGGSVTDGLAIYDTMQYIKCDVSTICMGMAASMGAFLLAAGARVSALRCPIAK